MHHQQRARSRRWATPSTPRDSGSGLLLAAGAAAVAACVAAYMLRPRPPSADNSDGPRYARRGEPERVGAAVTIAASAEELYARWRRFENFDQFMPNVVEVTPTGADGEAQWKVEGPAGVTFEFTSRILEDEPGRRIVWAAEGSPARHKGSVSFEETPRGTKVALEMDFDPPGGRVGMANANDPRRVARQALKRLKQLVETGEIARSRPDGTTSGSMKVEEMA